MRRSRRCRYRCLYRLVCVGRRGRRLGMFRMGMGILMGIRMRTGMHMDTPYGGPPYGAYERDGGGGRGPPGAAAYAREGPR
jgi:hypothetical protein